MHDARTTRKAEGENLDAHLAGRLPLNCFVSQVRVVQLSQALQNGLVVHCARTHLICLLGLPISGIHWISKRPVSRSKKFHARMNHLHCGASPVAYYKSSMSSLDYRGPFSSRMPARDDMMTKLNIIL